ncbi:MAG: translocation/assembly module TamB domain-containing protein [Sphingomonadaceae bacterium]|nr:translocation/assembly module TamB domain-containing protein [Sphingomonadaceae bacterium]
MDAATTQLIDLPQPAARGRVLRWVGGGFLAALLLAIAVLLGIDTDAGHRFLADRIARIRTPTGLRVHVGRIDGSVWSSMRLSDLRLSDPKGLFLEAPEVTLDWRPTWWLRNALRIDDLESDLVILRRLPQFRRTGNAPLLPSFDIHIGKLDARIRFEPAVAGTRRLARISGTADIHHRRALIRLAAASTANDRLALDLDAAPDQDRFDAGATLRAPGDGLVAGMIGTKKALALDLGGEGSWSRWNGRAGLVVGGVPIASLGLGVRAGVYTLGGRVTDGSITQGKLQRLTSPHVAVSGRATLADRRLNGRLGLRSEALALDATGTIDLARSMFDGILIDGRLLRPAALFPNMSGNGVRLRMTIDGPFAGSAFGYQLASPHIAFDNTGFDEVRATGRGRFSKSPVTVPIRLTAARVTGAGTVAGGILGNLSVDGLLKVTPKLLTGEGLALRSDKLTAKLALMVDLITGQFVVNLGGGLQRYLIPGLGIVDVDTTLRVVPGPGGKTLVTGHGKAWVRRLDNGFLRGLAGGLPSLDTGLVRDPDGTMHLTNLVLTAPALRLAGAGLRRRDGTFQFIGGGTHARYGPLKLSLDGDIAKPKLDIQLAAPLPALGLAGVNLALDPTPAGFDYKAAGGSTLGPFASTGAILTPPGGTTVIHVAALNVTGTRLSGNLKALPEGADGTLRVGGGGIDGALVLAPVGVIQKIEAHLALADATLAGSIATSARRGRIDGSVLLDPAGTKTDVTLSAQGLKRGTLFLARLAANARLIGDRGTIRASFAGNRGHAYAVQTVADVAPGSMRLLGAGNVDGRPLKLTSPALLTRDGDAWKLAPTGFAFGGGAATVAGRFGGSSANALDASLDAMPLAVLDIFDPALRLGGSATGKLSYTQASAGVPPSGRIDLNVRGLTRAGLVLSSAPVDVGLAGVLAGGAAAARAVVASGGQVIGRAQARIAPLSATGDLGTRLTTAPLFAQLRYNGPADTLWRLIGVQSIDLSGPVAIGADIGGTLANPSLKGSFATQKARLEGATTGTVIDGIAARGAFGGSKLVIDSFAGSTKGNGSVTGRASFDFGATHGFGMDIALQANKAQLLDRDDIAATVTGPVSIKSDGRGGTIAGDVQIEKGRFRLGRAQATAIPHLAVTEINQPADEEVVATPPVPWQLDIHADARNQLQVAGLGLDSEWRAKLDLKGAVNNPRILGRADLVRGSFDFAGKRFDLDRGAIRFTGSMPIDPVLDITAQANVTDLQAQIHVGGTGLQPQIDFTSTPALPEDELLSRLLFGTSVANLSAPEALQLAAAVASFEGKGGGGLNPINAVRKVIGLDRLRILPADITTGQKTSVAAGKYIGRRTYVELVTDGQGYSATNVEFQLTRWLSLLSTVSTIGRQSAHVRVSKDY